MALGVMAAAGDGKHPERFKSVTHAVVVAKLALARVQGPQRVEGI